MSKTTRRAVLINGVAATAPLLGCGGGTVADSRGDIDAGAGLPLQANGLRPVPVPTQVPAPAPAPAPAPVPTSADPSGGVSGRYRNQHTHLFQGSSWNVQPSRIAGGSARSATTGPSAEHVDVYAGWPWERLGGDWIDGDGVRHGPKPWTSVSTDAGTQTLVKRYSADATTLLRKVQAEDRWCALRVIALGAGRKIAGRWNTLHPIPTMEVVYTDGSTASLACIITALVKSGTPDPVSPEIMLPAFVEFDRPRKPVQKATFSVTVTQHSSSKAQIAVYLLDPPRNSDPVRQGVALSAGVQDANILSAAGIIGAQRYLDSSNLADFVHPGQINTWASREFDPVLWGGAPDKTKLPHKGQGKFITTNGEGWAQLVRSNYATEGFEPLAPGMAALRVHMPAVAKADGDVVGYGGTGAVNASIFMPEDLFGRLPRIFVRHYVRFGTPEGDKYLRLPKDRLHVYHNVNQVGPVWTDWGGKWGITPDHTTSYGGTSGSAGGGNGWQMRLAWSDSDANFNGPNDGGVRAGFHLYDFGPAQPAGHNYAGESGSRAYWGQRGGLGGVLYANNWYCVETEIKLNTVMDAAPGFLADGELRAWVDGRLVYERTGMVFRSKPLKATVPTGPTVMPPVRDLGVRALWLNWYHGGVTQNTVPRTIFITGLAYGTQYIGPMRL